MTLLGRQVYPVEHIHGGIQREKDYQVHLELLALRSVQGIFILLTLLSIAQDIEGSFKRSETHKLLAPNKTHAFRPMPRITIYQYSGHIAAQPGKFHCSRR